MKGHYSGVPEGRFFTFERQEVTPDDFAAPGYILDVGGGGEGVIGLLKGKQVIAIDSNKEELEDAASGPLKVVMDATELQFLDESFGAATSFYSLMFIDAADHPKVFEEVYRVLQPGGRFLIWDTSLPPRQDEKTDIAVIPVTVKVRGSEVTTGYGIRWPEKGRALSYYVGLAQGAGFEIVVQACEGQAIYLELRKPQLAG